MTDAELARAYLPDVHYDEAETIPLRAVGYTVARTDMPSPSFPKRMLLAGAHAHMTLEYAFYWDYDIQHMYDLEHIWVLLNDQLQVIGAEGSFHGGFMPLGLTGPLHVENGHVRAYCQPGKHAFLGDGRLFGALPFWRSCCMEDAGGDILVGGPFQGQIHPKEEDHRRCRAFIRSHLSFEPSLHFVPASASPVLMPWKELSEAIPVWVNEECQRLRALKS